MNSIKRNNSNNGNKRRKRVITDARKEQNRVAQRIYRQRQRERLQGWERRSQSSSARHHVLRPRKHGITGNATVFDPLADVFEPVQRKNRTSVDFEHDDLLTGPSLKSGELRHRSRRDPLDTDEVNPGELFSLSVATTAYMVDHTDPIPSSAISRPDLAVSQHSFVTPSMFGSNISGETTSDDTSPYANSWDKVSLTMFDPVKQAAASDHEPIEHEMVEELPKRFSIPRPTSTSLAIHGPRRSPHAFSRYSDTNPLTEEMLNRNLGIEDIISSGLDLLAGRSVQSNPLDLAITTLPDPIANTIQFSRASTFTAYLNNARSLGIKIQDLITHRYGSPFYRPAAISDDPKALLASVSNPSIPAHLQPTLPQILFPHHPYLDLLPFPLLRARAIALAATNPPLYSSVELKKDIIGDGLVCWRTSTRAGGRQPWDMRSWEAAPWFLKKWRMLVDGEDGEVWQQSRWWQMVRGENIS